MKQLQVGDTVHRRPVWAVGPGINRDSPSKLQRCTVVWVHPKGRFHTVRYDAPGGAIYESFKGVRER